MGDTIAAIEGNKLVGGQRRGTRRLHFVSGPGKAQSWIDAAQGLLADGHERLAIRLISPGLRPIAQALADALGPAIILQDEGQGLPQAGAVLLLAGEDGALDGALLDYLDLEQIVLAAPVTPRYWKNLPLYLISIPKAGTHLLFRLAETLGYEAGGPAPDRPRGGAWYYLLHSNAHTAARDFFLDTLQASPFGMRAHPFLRSPGLFNYRNPLDILVSEASYFHIEEKSPLALMLASLSEEERIERLLDDPWLLGTIRDRVGAFAPWLDCSNVIPVSFEEMVGSAGGGSDRALLALIWSLQLKLHVPGSPEEIKEALSVRAGPTFREGRIGGYAQVLSAGALERFRALPQDFMNAFGYSADGEGALLPARAGTFRHRPLVLGQWDPEGVPFLVDTNYFGHNIVAYNKRFVAVPMSSGPLDLAALAQEALDRFPAADDKDTLRGLIAAKEALRGSIIEEAVAERLPAIVDMVQTALSASPGDEAERAAHARRLLTGYEAELLAKLSDTVLTQIAAAARTLLIPELLGKLDSEMKASLLPALQEAFIRSLQKSAEQPRLEPSPTQTAEGRAQSTLFDRLRLDIINAIYSPLAGELHRELVRVMTPELINAIQPAIQAHLDRERVGPVHDLGALLGYRIWRRSDAYVAAPSGIGPVDPSDIGLLQKRGILASRTGLRLRLKILWKWIRWAYWDGAKI